MNRSSSYQLLILEDPSKQSETIFQKVKEVSHNIISQVENPKESLKYDETEAKWLVTVISEHTIGECYNQMFVL